MAFITDNILSEGYISGVTISATTFYGNGANITNTPNTFVTGGTYTNGSATFTNNAGSTFNVTGFSTNTTSIYTTGFSYSNNVFTITNNTGGTLSVLANQMTGLTATTISATSISGGGSGLINVGLRIKSNSINFNSFSGTPRKSTVTFVNNFSSTGYSITINSGDNRNWTYESLATSGFTINSNANTPLTQPVLWTAIQNGEY